MADAAPQAAAPVPETMSSYAHDGKQGFEKVDTPFPTPEGLDIVVKNSAVAANPVDIKVLTGEGDKKGRVVGWDAVGTVAAVGPAAQRFKVGDRVYYAGAIQNPGAFAEYTRVDERVVAIAPAKLSDADAAVIPLVGLTAFEGLTEKLGLSSPESIGKSILVFPGAGGVGSMVIQLAKKVLNMNVIATASRPETIAFCKAMGADHTINHREPLRPQLEALGLSGVNYVYNAYDQSESNFAQFADITLPNGGILNIVLQDPKFKLQMGDLFYKRISFHWEIMYQRTLSGDPAERIYQGKILQKLAFLLDNGVIHTTKQQQLEFSEAGLAEAMKIVSSGKAIGKVALS